MALSKIGTNQLDSTATPTFAELDVDNVKVNGNTISSTDTNGNVNIDPAGTGDTVMTGSGGQVTVDENGHITSKQSLDAATAGGRIFGASNRGTVGQIGIEQSATGADGGHIQLSTCASGSTSPTERLRVDSSGNVHVGKTTTGISTAGLSLRGDADVAQFTRDGGEPMELNRLSSDGPLIIFYKDNTQQGNIGANESYAYISGTTRGLRFGHSGSERQIVPVTASGQGSDNNVDLGSASLRFDDVYAYSGVTTGSDENDKQQIASLTAAEMTAAKAISKLFKTFKWNSAVAEPVPLNDWLVVWFTIAVFGALPIYAISQTPMLPVVFQYQPDAAQ